MAENMLFSIFAKESFDLAPFLELVLLLCFYFSFASTWGKLVEADSCEAPSFADYYRRWQLENNIAQLIVLFSLVEVLSGAHSDGLALAIMRVFAWIFFASAVYVLGRQQDSPIDSPEAVLTECRMERLQWHRRWLRKRMGGARLWMLLMGMLQAWVLLKDIAEFVAEVAAVQEPIRGMQKRMSHENPEAAADTRVAFFWTGYKHLGKLPHVIVVSCCLVLAMLAFSEVWCLRSKEFVGEFSKEELEAFSWPDGQIGHYDHQRKPERVEHGRSLRIVVVTVGTRGDVQPYVALGRHLIDKGHRLVIASQWNHRDFVEEAGVDFVDVGVPGLQQPEEWLTIQSIGEMMQLTVNYMLERPMPAVEGPKGRVEPQPPGSHESRLTLTSAGRARSASRGGSKGSFAAGPADSSGESSGYEVMMRAVFAVARGTHVELQEGALRADRKITSAEVGSRHWEQRADVVVSTNHTLSQVQMTALKLGIPMFNFKLQPDVCTAGYGPPGQRSHSNGFMNQLAHHQTWWDIIKAAFQSGISKQEEGFRRSLGLADISVKSFFRSFYYQPTVGCFSRLLIPSPDEDPDFQFASGFFMTDDDEYEPPIGLALFLKDTDILHSSDDIGPGPGKHFLALADTDLILDCVEEISEESGRLSRKSADRVRSLCDRFSDHPDMSAATSRRVTRATVTRPGYLRKRIVAVNFGSMVLASRSGLVARVVNEVLRRGMKCLLITGWADVPDGVDATNPDLLCMKGVPHGYAFRWVDCVIHHGGAGTTARVLSCSKPAIIVPILRWADQLQWAEWIDRRGFGVMIDEREPSTKSIRSALDKVFAKAKPLVAKYGTPSGLRAGGNDIQLQTDEYGARLRVEPSLDKAEAALFSCLCEQMLAPADVDIVRRDILAVEMGADVDFAQVPDPEKLNVRQGMCFIHCVHCHARRVELGLRKGNVVFVESDGLAGELGDIDMDSSGLVDPVSVARLSVPVDASRFVEQQSGVDSSVQDVVDMLQLPNGDDAGMPTALNANGLSELDDNLSDGDEAATMQVEFADLPQSNGLQTSPGTGDGLPAAADEPTSLDRLDDEVEGSKLGYESLENRTMDDTDDGLLAIRQSSRKTDGQRLKELGDQRPPDIDKIAPETSDSDLDDATNQGQGTGQIDTYDEGEDEDIDQTNTEDEDQDIDGSDTDDDDVSEADPGSDAVNATAASEGSLSASPRLKTYGSAGHMLVSTYLDSSPVGTRSGSIARRQAGAMSIEGRDGDGGKDQDEGNDEADQDESNDEADQDESNDEDDQDSGDEEGDQMGQQRSARAGSKREGPRSASIGKSSQSKADKVGHTRASPRLMAVNRRNSLRQRPTEPPHMDDFIDAPPPQLPSPSKSRRSRTPSQSPSKASSRGSSPGPGLDSRPKSQAETNTSHMSDSSDDETMDASKASSAASAKSSAKRRTSTRKRKRTRAAQEIEAEIPVSPASRPPAHPRRSRQSRGHVKSKGIGGQDKDSDKALDEGAPPLKQARTANRGSASSKLVDAAQDDMHADTTNDDASKAPVRSTRVSSRLTRARARSQSADIAEGGSPARSVASRDSRGPKRSTKPIIDAQARTQPSKVPKQPKQLGPRKTRSRGRAKGEATTSEPTQSEIRGSDGEQDADMQAGSGTIASRAARRSPRRSSRRTSKSQDTSTSDSSPARRSTRLARKGRGQK